MSNESEEQRTELIEDSVSPEEPAEDVTASPAPARHRFRDSSLVVLVNGVVSWVLGRWVIYPYFVSFLSPWELKEIPLVPIVEASFACALIGSAANYRLLSWLKNQPEHQNFRPGVKLSFIVWLICFILLLALILLVALLRHVFEGTGPW